MKQHKTY